MPSIELYTQRHTKGVFDLIGRLIGGYSIPISHTRNFVIIESIMYITDHSLIFQMLLS